MAWKLWLLLAEGLQEEDPIERVQLTKKHPPSLTPCSKGHQKLDPAASPSSEELSLCPVRVKVAEGLVQR